MAKIRVNKKNRNKIFSMKYGKILNKKKVYDESNFNE